MGLRNWLFGKKFKKLEEKINKLQEADKEEYFSFDSNYQDKNITLGVGADVASKVLIGNNTSLGDYSYVRERSIIGHNVQIGKYCAIARDVCIAPWLHPTNWLSVHPFQYGLKYKDTEKVTIGNDVWIGTKVTVMDGVTIGHGAIIGAGAVVTKDIPPYAIAVGVPARVIKYRFSDDIIKQLLELNWWDLDIETLYKHNIEFSNIERATLQLRQASDYPNIEGD